MALSVSRASNFDERSPLARMRRVQLWALCRQEGIPINEKETKDQLVMKMLGASIDPDNPPKLELDPAITGGDETAPTVNYGSLNFFQLRALCKERGIDWAKTDKRADLLKKLGVE